MDENTNKENMGELIGFDSPSDSSQDVKSGYTVTPEGGYYNTQQESREPSAFGTQEEPPEAPAEDEYREESVHGQFVPNGSYGRTPPQRQEPYIVGTDNRPPKKPSEKRFTLAALIAAVLVAALVGAGTGVGTLLSLNGGFAVQEQTGQTASGTDAVSSQEASNNTVNINVQDINATMVEAVAEKVTSSVVGIRTTVSVNNFFGGTSQASGEGSGVIYTADGYIITNYHVIQEAVEYSSSSPEIQVFLSSDSENGYPAAVVGYNISYDLAVIKIDTAGLNPVTFADSSGLKVGQFVVAIGNPGGLEFMGSVTYGVISGLNRIISDTNSTSAVELIQTDAAINPGNSGGALVNINGELIGVNSSKIVSESYEGMGFAIPANTVKEICDKIIAKEYDPDPYIGVTISERYDADTLTAYGYPVGAVVYSVANGSPAAEAGIQSGDIITEFNGVEITNYTVLDEALSTCEPGDTVTVKIYRSRRTYSANITVGSNNSQ